MTRPTLWIVDVTNIAFRALHAAPPLSNSAGIQTGGAYLFARMMLAFLNERRPTHVAAVWDAPARSFRKDLSPTYKANRPPLDEDLKRQLRFCRAVIMALPLPVLQVAGVEADDTMATLALRAWEDGMDPVLMTSDKDLMTLVGAPVVPAQDGVGVRFYDPQKQKFFGPAEVREKWAVEPHLVSDLLALTGDASDNIEGVAGFGAKTAAKYLRQFGSLDALIERADEVTGKCGANLRAAVVGGTLALDRQLTALKVDVPLERAPRDLMLPPPDDEARRALFEELEFLSLLPSDMPTLEQLNARPGAPLYDAAGKRA